MDVKIIAIVLVGIILFAFLVPVVPVTFDEPHEVQVPYTVQISYEVPVEVTKTRSVVDRNIPIGSVTFKAEDFSMPSAETATISWMSTEQVTFFGVIKKETWRNIQLAIAAELGAAIIPVLISGGVVAVGVPEAIAFLLPLTLNFLVADEYFRIDSTSDTEIKNLNSGPYKLAVISFGREGSLSVRITFDYQTIEMQTHYRNETRHRTEIQNKTVKKMVTIWSFVWKTYLPI